MTEEQIHCQIAQYLKLVIKSPSRWWTIEVSNQQAGRAGMFKQIALKKKGVVTGTPDIQIIWVNPDSDGWGRPELKLIFLEVKAAKGRLTEKQEALHEELRDEGHQVHVVRSVDDVTNVLKEVGII